MPKIADYVNAKEIAVYYTEAVTNDIPLLGEVLWPSDKRLGLDLSWIKGSGGLPVALKPSAFDAKATLRDRVGFEKLSTEMPFFREAMRIDEKDRQEILKVMSAANVNMIKPLLTKIYDDAGNLIKGSDVQKERMRMQLLCRGSIAITENRTPYNYDYRFDFDNNYETLVGTAQWSDLENAKIVQDIQRIQSDVEDRTGTKPTRAVCTRKTWNYILGNKGIVMDLNPIGGQNIIMTDELLKDYLKKKLGISVTVYNKKYKLELNGSSYQYFDDDIFTFIPDGNLGKTWHGTSPEEADLMSGNTVAEVQIVNTGIAVTTIQEPHPVNTNTIVSGIFLPSFEAIDNVYILKVHSE